MNDCKDEKKEKSGISVDLKLFLVFFFGQGFIEPFIFRFKTVEYRIVYAVILSGILIGLSIWHKIYNQWKWPGISISNVFTVLFCLLVGTGILAHWANDLLNMPPWYQGDIRNIPFNALYLIKAAILQKFIFLVPVGFLIFYILICLNLVTINKDDFSACCRDPRPFIKKNLSAEIWKFLKNSVISTKICSPTGKTQSFFAKIISELESPREFKFEKTEKTVEVSFYIVRAEIIKNTWRNFLLLGCIIVLFVVLVNHVFIGWLVDGAPLMPLYKLLFSISLGAMGAVVFGIFIYMYCLCIYNAFVIRKLTFCNEYFEIGRKILDSYKTILKIPRKELPELNVKKISEKKSDYSYDKLFVIYNEKEVEIASDQPRKETDIIKCLYENYMGDHDISKVYIRKKCQTCRLAK